MKSAGDEGAKGYLSPRGRARAVGGRNREDFTRGAERPLDKRPDNCYKAIMSRPKTKPPSMLTDVLRAAIEESGLTQYRIAKDTGIVPTSLMRFLRGETSLRLDKADALAVYLGLELVKRRKEP